MNPVTTAAMVCACVIAVVAFIYCVVELALIIFSHHNSKTDEVRMVEEIRRGLVGWSPPEQKHARERGKL